MSPSARMGTISTKSPGTRDPPHIGSPRRTRRRCPGSSPTTSEASLPLIPPPSVASRHKGGSRVSGGEGGYHVPAATQGSLCAFLCFGATCLVASSAVSCRTSQAVRTLNPADAVPDTGAPTGGGGAAGHEDTDADPAARVDGSVVEGIYRVGLPGRTVVIGNRQTTTRDDGTFSIEAASSKYDALVVEPDRRYVTIYYGLTRRDPVLTHQSSGSGPSYVASNVPIAGRLSGSFGFPLEPYHQVDVYFLADSTFGAYRLNSFLNAGPEFGPMEIPRRGTGPVTGDLVALGRILAVGQGWVGSAVLAWRTVTLADAGLPSQDLTLLPVGNARLAGSVKMYEGGRGVGGYWIDYFERKSKEGISLDRRSAVSDSFDFEVPDLTEIGGEYCIGVSDNAGRANAIKCNIQASMENILILVDNPPEIQRPLSGAPVSKDTVLSWTAVPNSVYSLWIGPSDQAGQDLPGIRVYTTETQLRWPNLEAIGVPFRPSVKYEGTVAAFAPFGSVDDVASWAGPEPPGTDRQRLFSASFEATTVQ